MRYSPATKYYRSRGDVQISTGEPVPDSTDAVLAHLAGEDVSGGLLGRLRGLL